MGQLTITKSSSIQMMLSSDGPVAPPLQSQEQTPWAHPFPGT